MKCWFRWDFSFQAHEDLPQALTAVYLLESNDPTVYVGTGANAHMTNNPGMLKHLAPCQGSDKVVVEDGDRLTISHIGDITINSTHGSIKLRDVLVVPSIQKNLPSISQLTKDESCLLRFSNIGFMVKDWKTGTTVATGSKSGNLYAIDGNVNAPLTDVKNGKAPKDIWHQRLGHPHSKFLRVLNFKNNVNVSSWNKVPILCSSCQMGKSCRLPFQMRNTIGNIPFSQNT